MFLIFSLLGALAVILEEVLLTSVLGVALSDFYMMFVLPVGVLILTWFLGWFLSIGVQIGGFRNRAVILTVSFLLGISMMPIIYYTEYRVTYVDEKGDANMHFNGVPINTLELTEGGTYGFQDYMEYRLSNSTMSIGRRRQATVDVGMIFSVIQLGIQMLLFGVGTAFLADAYLKDPPIGNKKKRKQRMSFVKNKR